MLKKTLLICGSGLLFNFLNVNLTEHHQHTDNIQSQKVIMSDNKNTGISPRGADTYGPQLAVGYTSEDVVDGSPNFRNAGDTDYWRVINHIFTRKLIDAYLKDTTDHYKLGIRQGDQVKIPLIWDYFDFSGGPNGRGNVTKITGGVRSTFQELMPSMIGKQFTYGNIDQPMLRIDWSDIPSTIRRSDWKDKGFRSAFGTESGLGKYLRINWNKAGSGKVNDTISYRFAQDSGGENPSHYLIFERTKSTFNPELNSSIKISGTVNYDNNYNGADVTTYKDWGDGTYTWQWQSRDRDSRSGFFSPKIGINSINPEALIAKQNQQVEISQGQSLESTNLDLKSVLSVTGKVSGSILQVDSPEYNKVFTAAGKQTVLVNVKEILDDTSRELSLYLNIDVKADDKSSLKTKDLTINLGDKVSWDTAFVSGTDEKGNKLNWSDGRITTNGLSASPFIDTNIVGEKKYTYTYKGKFKNIDSTFTVKVEWGNALKLNGTGHQTILALTLNKGNDNYIVNATRGLDDKKNNLIHQSIKEDYLTISFFRAKDEILNDSIPYYEVTKKGDDKVDEAYKAMVPQKVIAGDIIRIKHKELVGDELFVGLFTDNNWSTPTRGFVSDEAFFVVNNQGQFESSTINQLDICINKIPIYSNKSYLDENINNYLSIKKYPEIRIKGFGTYPKTNMPGQNEGTILVEDKLKSGNTIQWKYKVPFEVSKGELDLSVPSKIDFEEFTPSFLEKNIPIKEESRKGVEIFDSRGEGFQGDWTLTAQIKGNKGISPYMIYRNEYGLDSYLNQGAVSIDKQEKEIHSNKPIKKDISSSWNNKKGIFLKIPTKNTLKSQIYESEIMWNIIEGP